ncbi:glycosyltransferase [Komagataeibacter rhaeticus]|nr:glycosyltransferase [Komagataeibacter rhaeticus]
MNAEDTTQIKRISLTPISVSTSNFWQKRKVSFLTDMLFDLHNRKFARQVRRMTHRYPLRHILVTSVHVPKRGRKLRNMFNRLSITRHRVDFLTADMGDRGKFSNINAALAQVNLKDYDWVVVMDDDVALPQHFLDTFIPLCEVMDLKISQPAHRHHSYTSFTFNYRRWNSLGRVTRYVEDGPVTAFHRDAIAYLFPFPELRWAWATDILFCHEARRNNHNVGIVDYTAIEHLKPAAQDYPRREATAEARAFLSRHALRPDRQDLFRDTGILRHINESHLNYDVPR